MDGALKGIRVIDWTIWQQGPAATLLLADLGADVIKIEQPELGDPVRGIKPIVTGIPAPSGGRQNFYFETFNRNKRSIALDLKHPKARQVVYRLIEGADVFIQNYRKGVAKRLQIDYQTLSSYNPRLIYVSITGYGAEGPHSGLPANDMVGQARSGVMMATNSGEIDPPRQIRGFVSDQVGGIMTALATVTALLVREQRGIGQEIDTSILGSMVFLQAYDVGCRLLSGEERFMAPREKRINPLMNCYRCSDGKWIQLGNPQSDLVWTDFCKVAGIERLEKDPKFINMAQREIYCQELIVILDGVFIKRRRDEWLKIFYENPAFIAAPVNSITDLCSDVQALANKYIVDFDYPGFGSNKILGFPFNLSRMPFAPRFPAPELGQHTEEVLLEAGYSREEIDELRREGAIVGGSA